MKLLYHSLGSIDTGYGNDRKSDYSDRLIEYVDEVSRSDTTVEIRGTENGGIADSYRFFAGLDTADVLETIIHTHESDVDGLILGNIFDPGLREGRELLSIPVTGQLETSVMIAQFVADKYGIVSINNKQSSHSLDRLRMYEQTPRLARIEGMNADISAISNAYSDEDVRSEVFSEFERVGRKCIEDGAEVLIPGGGILGLLLSDHGVDEVDGVPVIDQVAISVQATEFLVDLYRIGALQTSSKGTFEAPESALVSELEELYFG